MLIKLFHLCLLINIIPLKIVFGNSTLPVRQKMILSLSESLFIKNVVVFKQSFEPVDSRTISFAKSLSQSQIYTSCLSMEEARLIQNGYKISTAVFLKTLILSLSEESNKAIYDLISENEKAQSQFLWLVWNKKNQELINPQADYIPYNSQLFIVEDVFERDKNVSYITEIYHPRIFSPIMFKRHFGVWSENKGLKIPEMDLYKRRFDMNGTSLNVFFGPTEISWGNFVLIIIKVMNFRPRIFRAYDLRNQCYDLKIGDCEIDLRIHANDYRSRYNDILGFVSKTSVHMYIRYDEISEVYKLVTYIRPFSRELWWAVLIFIFTVGICTLILAYKDNDFGFLNAFYHPLEAFMNQDGSTTPKSIFIRTAIITTRFTALFIVPAYSAFLLTYILLPNIKLPFTDIKGLVQDGSYKIGFSLQSHLDTWLKDSEDIWLKTAHAKYLLERDEMPMNEKGIWETICRYKKVSFIASTNVAHSAHCQVIKISTPVATGWEGLNLRKNSPYKKIFNRIMKSIFSSGLLRRFDQIKQKVDWLTKSKNPSFKNENEEISVKIENVKSILQILFLLYITAIILLFLECLYNILNRRFLNKKNSQKA